MAPCTGPSGLGPILLTGCAAGVIVRTESGADLGSSECFFVEKNPDDRDGIELLLRDELSRRGRTVEAGPSDEVTEDVDVLVRYATTWERNVFRRFLSGLEVRFVDARTEEVVVEARGPRTDARSRPNHMVEAVIRATLEPLSSRHPPARHRSSSSRSDSEDRRRSPPTRRGS